MARQRHIYETAFDLRVKQRVPDQGLDQMAQSPVVLLPGLQQQPHAGPLHPVPSSSSSSGVSVIPGRKGGITRQPSLQDAYYPKPPPHQGSSYSTSAFSRVQQQPAPTARGSSNSGSGEFRFLLPCRGQGLAFKLQASAADKASYQNNPLPRPPISENPFAVPIGAVAVKRSIHAGVKVARQLVNSGSSVQSIGLKNGEERHALPSRENNAEPRDTPSYGGKGGKGKRSMTGGSGKIANNNAASRPPGDGRPLPSFPFSPLRLFSSGHFGRLRERKDGVLDRTVNTAAAFGCTDSSASDSDVLPVGRSCIAVRWDGVGLAFSPVAPARPSGYILLAKDR
ncbi:hypothetical protein HPB49_021155 [Dermacentor silvarum]|uniref:Uncharacterized protein n=1 Tax=Dermacentor silvarum TaxID=543639 RepID=A0ACB8C5I0_DERSI|nr:hypothetical protein HPB49_021155 [Dermacentor silvarum]